MCTDDGNYKKTFKLYGLILWAGLTCHKVMCNYWTADYFHCYLNQMPKPNL